MTCRGSVQLFVVAALAASIGCIAGVSDFTPPSSGGGGGGGNGGGGGPPPLPPPPASVQGFVTSPLNGQLFQGTTTQTTINVNGTYTGTSNSVSVQIMDPTNNDQWSNVGAASIQSGTFATTVGPFNALQFPQGGLLAIRVIDGNGAVLPYQLNNDETYSNTALMIGSPGENPTDWNFLTQQPTGTEQETALYYDQIGAPKTLDDFKTEFFPDGVPAAGVSGTAATALYYNKGDLAVGRALSCNNTQVGGVACFVAALGSFDGNEDVALNDLENPDNVTPVATVAMVYNPPITNPNAVQFIVYNGQGDLQDFAKLDGFGDNQSVPQNCLNCHGGQATFDAQHFEVTGAQWLQLDPLAMDFNSNERHLLFSEQQNALFAMEQLTTEASPTTTTRELIAGEWTNEGGNATFNPSFIPAAWDQNQRDANLYQQAIAPFCRGCHASVGSDATGLAFASPQDFVANAQKIVTEVCGAGPNGMPVAQATSTRFFDGISPGCNQQGCTPNTIAGQVQMSGRALILEYLGQAGAAAGGCAAGQIQ
jgi:hypothetical protein